jgi:hypothetical protein
MSPGRGPDIAMAAAAGLALLVAFLWWPPPGTSAGDPQVGAVVGAFSLTGAIVLLVTVFWVLSIRQRLEEDNPARLPWALLGCGLALLGTGEAIEAADVLLTGEPNAFPSWPDVVFVPAYPFLLLSFALFLRVYRVLSPPEPGEATTDRLTAALLVMGGALAAFPVARTDTPWLERGTSLAYVGFDVLVVIVLLRLLRLTWRFRGGNLWKIWAGILAGFLFTSVADLLFAYSQSRAIDESAAGALEVAVEVVFLLAYLAIARGTFEQRRILVV